MPLTVALLAHPAGAYACLVVAVAAVAYGARVRRFVPLFAGSAAGFLAVLGFMHVPPRAIALVLLAAGVALLHAEFRSSTSGVPGALALAALLLGSWWVLSPANGALTLPLVARALLALVGTGCVLFATLVSQRRSR